MAIGPDLASRLKASGAKAVLLTGRVDSPALSAAIAAISARTGLRHVTWSPVESDAAGVAWKQAFGDPKVARPRLDKADLIVGLGAEFLDRPEEGYEREFAARRAPDETDGGAMGRFVQIEGRLTLTGANADRRIRVRDSHLAAVAASLAHELVVVRHVGPLAGSPDVGAALAPFPIDAVAKQAGLDADALRSLAGELADSRGKAIVVAGGTASTSATGPALELAATLLNITVGAFDAGLFDNAAATEPSPGGAAALAALAAEMHAGGIEMLIVAGVNPVYDAPAFGPAPDAGKASDRPTGTFAEAIAKVPFVVSLNDRLDETSLLADVLAPASHPFEAWGDAALPKSIVAIQQPVIQPLFDTRGLLDVVVEWAAAVGDPAAIAAVTAAAAAVGKAPAPNTAAPAPSPSIAWHYLRAAWATRLGGAAGTPDFDTKWNEVLRTGMWSAKAGTGGAGGGRGADGGSGRDASPPFEDAQGAVSASRTARRPISGPLGERALPRFNAAALSLLASAALKPTLGVDLQLYPHLALGDGRSGNNGWLHELPDPITRLTWDGALSIAPRRFDEMKLANGDLVEVDAGDRQIVAPAYRHAGMHHDQVALPLGFGRTACGVIGAGIGVNAFPLRRLVNGRLVSAGLPVRIRKVAGRAELALAQGSDVIDRERRPLVPTTTLAAYQGDRTSGTEQQEGGRSSSPRLAGRWRSISASATAAASASSPARRRTTSRWSAARASSTAGRCRGSGSTGTTTRPRRTAAGAPRSGTGRSTWWRSRGPSSSRCCASTARTRRAKRSARSWRRCTARTG
jgi:molybdopterin-containing oxidoreductase family iron-sulfur binding subunit